MKIAAKLSYRYGCAMFETVLYLVHGFNTLNFIYLRGRKIEYAAFYRPRGMVN